MSLSDEHLANIISELGSATSATPLTPFGKAALAMASELQQRRAYAKANPLGGPASMFRTIAERIEAGEEYWAVLRDYGLTMGGAASPKGEGLEAADPARQLTPSAVPPARMDAAEASRHPDPPTAPPGMVYAASIRTPAWRDGNTVILAPHDSRPGPEWRRVWVVDAGTVEGKGGQAPAGITSSDSSKLMGGAVAQDQGLEKKRSHDTPLCSLSASYSSADQRTRGPGTATATQQTRKARMGDEYGSY